jgi:hypothetical protein
MVNLVVKVGLYAVRTKVGPYLIDQLYVEPGQWHLARWQRTCGDVLEFPPHHARRQVRSAEKVFATPWRSIGQWRSFRSQEDRPG